MPFARRTRHCENRSMAKTSSRRRRYSTGNEDLDAKVADLVASLEIPARDIELVNEGAGAAHSFGVNIRLPFEAEPNPVIAEDPKLINFKYFFTRKLMFMKEASAFVLMPGGFGTMDETFEVLTLMQTGKSDMHPIVFLDAVGGTYWE